MINKQWLKEKNACNSGSKWFFDKFGNDADIDNLTVFDALISDDRLTYANWFIVRIMDRTSLLKYAVYAAEQVIGIFESKYPNDNRPRLAIAAVKKVLIDDNEENRRAAAAYADADAAAAYAAAYAAADADADADAAAAYAAAYAAAAAAYSSADAAYAAADAAADAARREMRLKILNYGRSLIVGDL